MKTWITLPGCGGTRLSLNRNREEGGEFLPLFSSLLTKARRSHLVFSHAVLGLEFRNQLLKLLKVLVSSESHWTIPLSSTGLQNYGISLLFLITTLRHTLEFCFSGRRDNSVCKILAVQVWGPKFRHPPPGTHIKLDAVEHLQWDGRWRQENPSGQPTLSARQ